ncbi:hypothetical protein ZHAS_00014417 [Anopheles sinensis]|uniref:Uncharacterized protein n=1 Tax=Anopheles sinensis TaxID=74873 RepID=A0A084W815_ANOSI|nr:hypothetical protein ZHAS_00014417 [Anopheles sinensis]
MHQTPSIAQHPPLGIPPRLLRDTLLLFPPRSEGFLAAVGSFGETRSATRSGRDGRRTSAAASNNNCVGHGAKLCKHSEPDALVS